MDFLCDNFDIDWTIKNNLNMALTGVPIPSIDWRSHNLPEVFRKFKRTCELIFAGPLSQIDEVQKITYLMIWADDEGRDIKDGWGLTDGDKKKLNVHWTRFEEYVKPKSTFRVARFQFRALKQQQGETIDAFMTKARVLADSCEYADKESQLIDCLIGGVSSDDIKKRLLAKDKTMTLDDGLTVARSYETTQRSMNQIQESTKSVQAVRTHHQKSQPRKKPTGTRTDLRRPSGCWNCGTDHVRGAKCPAEGATCNYCGKVGHWERVCIAKQTSTGARQKNQHFNAKPQATPDKRKGHGKSVHMVDTEQQESNSCFFDTIEVDASQTGETDVHLTHDIILNSIVIESILVDNKKMDQAFANIRIRDMDVKCKVDTGAQSNVMPIRVYRELFPGEFDRAGRLNSSTRLSSNATRLKAYGGGDIKQYGDRDIRCQHNNSTVTAPFYVADADEPTLLGLRTLTDLGIVTLNCLDKDNCRQCHAPSHISTINKTVETTKAQKTTSPKQALLDSYPECFKGIGAFPGTYHIQLRDDAVPVIHPPRRVPEALREPLRQELRRMQELGIIRKVDRPSDWVNSIICVEKENGDLRICLDPYNLNKAIRREHHYTQTLDDVLPRLSKAKVFSKLDARSGYWNVLLDEESMLLTTFNTPFGRYCFERLPFGLVSAQDVFQKKIDMTYEGLNGVFAIADDIIVSGEDDDDHDRNLAKMMERTKEVGLSLNASKCEIKQRKVKFYGHYLTDKGIEPDPDKVKAITDMRPPENLTELQSLLAMAKHLGSFTPKLSATTGPMRDLTKKDIDFIWGPEHDKALNELKRTIASADILAYFDATKPVTIQTDACTYGLGATLLQDGRPVAFASKSLTTTESNYSNIEREMLAIVFGLERFHHYAYGRHVTIESDHKPLESITKKSVSNAPPRLMRLLLRIQPYDCEVKYIPGKDIPVADALSRLPIKGPEIPNLQVHINNLVNVSPARLQQVKHFTNQDQSLTMLRDTVMNGWPSIRKQCPEEIGEYWNYRDEIAVYDGMLLKGDRVIIPRQLQPTVLEFIHAGHQGIDKCRLRARDTVFWCGINNDIELMVRNCGPCQEHQASHQKEPMTHIDATRAWEVIGTDLFHLNNDNYLLMVDYFTSYCVIRKLPSTKATTIITKMKAVMSEYGVPATVISDNGPQYSCGEFEAFATSWGFRHVTSSPHYPQANGKAERHVGTVKRTLQKALEDGQDPAMAMLCIRTTPIDNGLPSPADLMFKYKVNSNLPSVSRMQQHQDEHKQLMLDKHAKAEQAYNQTAKPLPEIEPGEYIRVQDPITKKWNPAQVREKCSELPQSYIVETSSGAVLRRNRRHLNKTTEMFHQADEAGDTPPPLDEPPALPAMNAATPASCTTTRSGRVINPPKRLDL